MCKMTICAAAMLACALPLSAKKQAAQATEVPAEVVTVTETIPDSVSVAVGVSLGNYVKSTIARVTPMGVTVDPDVFVETLRKVLKNEPAGMLPEVADAYIQQVIDAHNQSKAQVLSAESQDEFIKSVASAPGAVTTPAGVVLQVITEGEGDFPQAGDTVKVTYKGQLADGTVFDDSHGEAITFPLSQVVPGFSDGIMHMRPGGKYRIVFPASMGYGETGIPGVIPGNAALDFTVDLIGVEAK